VKILCYIILNKKTYVSVRLGVINEAKWLNYMANQCGLYLSRAGSIFPREAGLNKTKNPRLIYAGGSVIAYFFHPILHRLCGSLECFSGGQCIWHNLLEYGLEYREPGELRPKADSGGRKPPPVFLQVCASPPIRFYFVQEVS